MWQYCSNDVKIKVINVDPEKRNWEIKMTIKLYFMRAFAYFGIVKMAYVGIRAGVFFLRKSWKKIAVVFQSISDFL